MDHLANAIPAKDLKLSENYKIKVALTGPSGSGKSTGFTTMPGNILVIDYDGRKETYEGYPNVDVLPCEHPDPLSPKAWTMAEEIRKEIVKKVKDKTFDYDSVIEDGLSSLLSICMRWCLLLDPKRGLGGVPAMQHYLPQMVKVADHIKSYISLPIHYGLAMHLEIIEDEEMGGLKYLPKATGKMRTDIPNWFNESYFCWRKDSEDKKTEYFWNTSGTGKWDFLKSTLNSQGKNWNDPIRVDLNKEPAGFRLLWEKRFKTKGTKNDKNRA